MVIIEIDELLKTKGKTRYWLGRQTDCNNKTITALANNETTSIRFDTLEKICQVLECSPNDVIRIEQ